MHVRDFASVGPLTTQSVREIVERSRLPSHFGVCSYRKIEYVVLESLQCLSASTNLVCGCFKRRPTASVGDTESEA